MELICYASGSGALSFTFVEREWNNRIDEWQKLSSSKQVTRKDIELYLKSEDGKHFKEKGYLIVQFGEERIEKRTIVVSKDTPKRKGPGRPKKGQEEITEEIEIVRQPQFQLCAPVSRIGVDLLQLDGSVFQYQVDKENTFWTRDRKYTDYNTSITTNRMYDDEEYEVRNISTKLALIWFLNNERTIIKQHPEQNKLAENAEANLANAVAILREAGLDEDDVLWTV